MISPAMIELSDELNALCHSATSAEIEELRTGLTRPGGWRSEVQVYVPEGHPPDDTCRVTVHHGTAAKLLCGLARDAFDEGAPFEEIISVFESALGPGVNPQFHH